MYLILLPDELRKNPWLHGELEQDGVWVMSREPELKRKHERHPQMPIAQLPASHIQQDKV